MKELTDEQLEIAVGNYVDSMDMDTILDIVYSNIYKYFSESADEEETLEFVSTFAPEDTDNE